MSPYDDSATRQRNTKQRDAVAALLADVDDFRTAQELHAPAARSRRTRWSDHRLPHAADDGGRRRDRRDATARAASSCSGDAAATTTTTWCADPARGPSRSTGRPWRAGPTGSPASTDSSTSATPSRSSGRARPAPASSPGERPPLVRRRASARPTNCRSRGCGSACRGRTRTAGRRRRSSCPRRASRGAGTCSAGRCS